MKWVRSPSVVPELERMQQLSGPSACCFCLRPLKRKGSKMPRVCWSADCRTELQAIRTRRRTETRHEALRSLTRIVASLGWSTKNLERLVSK